MVAGGQHRDAGPQVANRESTRTDARETNDRSRDGNCEALENKLAETQQAENSIGELPAKLTGNPKGNLRVVAFSTASAEKGTNILDASVEPFRTRPNAVS